jgi:DNA replication and repair protein RecF
VRWVELEDFRNYAREAVEFDPGLNLVSGRNAQGKTNLLEGIYCLGGLGSPRSADAALVKNGTERALLHAEIRRGTRSIRIDLEFRPGRGQRALVNRTPVSGVKALRELTTAVFFGPDDVGVVKGAPDGRRRFIDDLVVKLRPGRDVVRRDWERVLRQRNTLLKTAPARGRSSGSVGETLAVWDESFCRVGAQLVVARLEVLSALLPYVQKRYEAVAGGGRLELGYDSSWLGADVKGVVHSATSPDPQEVQAMLQAKLEEVRAREIERGASLVGPQRDDMEIRLLSDGGQGPPVDARVYGSQGDQRTSALALKLGEYDLLTDALQEEPILLLDDVFSELDARRRKWLIESVGEKGQVIVSSAETAPTEVLGVARVIEVSEGHVHALK